MRNPFRGARESGVPGRELGRGARTSTGGPRAATGRPRKAQERALARQKANRRRRLRRAAPRAAVAAALVVAVAALALVAGGPHPAAPPPPAPPTFEITFRLSIFNGTQQVEVPAGIGVDPAMYADHSLDANSPTPGTAVLHTRDASGTVLVDSKTNQTYLFGDFWHIWNQPYGPSRTLDMRADANHTLKMTVDGAPYTGSSWGQLVLKDGMRIEIHYDAA